MARDYRLHDYNYIQLLDLQPPQQYYNANQTDQSSSSAYELTSVGGGGGASSGACEPPGGNLVAPHPPTPHHLQHQHQHQHHDHDPRKRKNSHFSEQYAMSGCEAPLQVPSTPGQHIPSPASATRKRKASSYGTASAYDDDGEDVRSVRTLPDKKQNHSEIEKRRRDKMNTYISELSAMVPMCGAMSRKLDKLTVLRMAVQHLRTVRGSLSACPLTARPRPAFLSERELNELILQAAHDTFLIVVGCDRGRLLYVSESVKNMLHYDQSELLGQSMFDLLHPKDVAKVKEQLSSSDLSPRERLIDAKTMLPVKADVLSGASRLCPGARRSFFCRIKCKALPDQEDVASHVVKEEPDPTSKLRKKQNEKKYCVVQCTGYLKSWAPAEMSEGGSAPEGVDESEACNLSCLVAVGRALPDLAPQTYPNPTSAPATRSLQYVSRHAIDGKYLFVDQRVTLALGFLPQELLGTSLYEYVNGPELGAVARTHKAALVRRDPLLTPPYSFRKKDGSLALLQTHFKPFRNPWTKDVECLVANNTVVTESQALSSGDDAQAAFDVFKQKGDPEMQQLIDSQVESQKIGSAIAEEVLRRSSSEFSPDLPADLLQDVVFNEQASLVDNILGVDLATFQVGELTTLNKRSNEDHINEVMKEEEDSTTYRYNKDDEMKTVNPNEVLGSILKTPSVHQQTTDVLPIYNTNISQIHLENSQPFTQNHSSVIIKTDVLLSSTNTISSKTDYSNYYNDDPPITSLSLWDSTTTSSEFEETFFSNISTTFSNYKPSFNANNDKPVNAGIPKAVVIKKLILSIPKTLNNSPLDQRSMINASMFLPCKHKLCSFPGNEKVLTVLLTVFRLPFSFTKSSKPDKAILGTHNSLLIDDQNSEVHINMDLKDGDFVRSDLTDELLRKSWFVVQRRRRVIISSRSYETVNTIANTFTWYSDFECNENTSCRFCSLPTSSLLISRSCEAFYVRGCRIYFSPNTIHVGKKSYRFAKSYVSINNNVFTSRNTNFQILNPKAIKVTKKLKKKENN